MNCKRFTNYLLFASLFLGIFTNTQFASQKRPSGSLTLNDKKKSLSKDMDKEMAKLPKLDDGQELAILAGGCFWCVEAVYERVNGVKHVISGYAGGSEDNPNYATVSSGKSTHAEAVYIIFEPKEISYAEILDIFWKAHDPTTLNRQGNDIGRQYRSAIFYMKDEQKSIAENSIKKNQEKFNNKIVTEITKIDKFYPAENYHQDYERKHPNDPYIVNVAREKIRKSGVENK